ncbi:hypothetical protein HPB49_003916 [Dermacentor silvarum]|uniref:Uncharacterized protein n=1 Tax=Dermacentor silvarum TaxID=543639 RepID=A0ACB8C782_DERSI|nr:hypothetical protein HPB49_003916 [Dermacentor silvarum]
MESSLEMAYCVEGENITPEEFESDPRWERALEARKAAYPNIQHAASTPLPSATGWLYRQCFRFNTPPPPGDGSTGFRQTKRHAPLRKLPKTDLKIRHSAVALSYAQCNGGVLLPLVCAATRTDHNTTRQQDKLRLNPFNNSFTVSTPAKVGATRYVAVDSLLLGTVKYPLRAYVAAPDDAVRGIIYNALYNQPEKYIIQDFEAINKSSQYTITDTRPLDKTKSTLITFINVQALLKQLNFYGTQYACHPFKAEVEACHNCWRAGHRVDLCAPWCPNPKRKRCPRCGVEQQLVESPTYTARCILCGEVHFTRSKKCKVRFDHTGKYNSPPATDKVTLVTEQNVKPDYTHRRSCRSRTRLPSYPQQKTASASRSRTQSRTRYSSASTTGCGRTRSCSTSYAPVPMANTQTTKQVSWGLRSPSLEWEDKELRAQLQKRSADITELSEQIQLLRDMHTRRTGSPNSPALANALSFRPPPPPAPQASNPPPRSRATSLTRTPPQKRHAQTYGSGDNSKNESIYMAGLANAIQSMQQSLMVLQKNNAAWMADIANILTALEQRQVTQQATVPQIKTQLNRLLPSNSTASASVAESLHSHRHGSTP